MFDCWVRAKSCLCGVFFFGSGSLRYEILAHFVGEGKIMFDCWAHFVGKGKIMFNCCVRAKSCLCGVFFFGSGSLRYEIFGDCANHDFFLTIPRTNNLLYSLGPGCVAGVFYSCPDFLSVIFLVPRFCVQV